MLLNNVWVAVPQCFSRVDTGEINTVLVIEGDSVTLRTDTEKMDEERIFGDIANFFEGRFSAYSGPDGKFKDRQNNVTDKPITEGE